MHLAAVLMVLAAAQRPPPLLYPQLPATQKLDPLRAIRMYVHEMSSEVPRSYELDFGASARAVHGLGEGRAVMSSAQAQAMLITSLAATSPGMRSASQELLGHALSFFLGWRRIHPPAG